MSSGDGRSEEELEGQAKPAASLDNGAQAVPDTAESAGGRGESPAGGQGLTEVVVAQERDDVANAKDSNSIIAASTSAASQTSADMVHLTAEEGSSAQPPEPAEEHSGHEELHPEDTTLTEAQIVDDPLSGSAMAGGADRSQEEASVAIDKQGRPPPVDPQEAPERSQAGIDGRMETNTDKQPPLQRPSIVSVASSTADEPGNASYPTVIYGVCLVGFHHALGPVVEYTYPHALQSDEDIIKNLPFLSLPDGAHSREEDYSCFHLYLPNIAPTTIYGISCIRQLRADELVRRTSDVTRSNVQKAVVVLANKPVFGPIRDKLGVITRAFFAQKDFQDTTILNHFYTSLENTLRDDDQTSENAIYIGMSLREFVWKFRLQTLILFKLLILQKKVMLWGSQVERLCSFQYSLVSLIPLLLLSLEDAASPVLDTRSVAAAKPSSLKTSDRTSLLRYIGLPLNVFGKGAFFQPYLPLQQLDLLKADSYLVGTTNSIFQSQKDCQIDVLVNIDTANIDFLNPKIASLVHLTAADRKWMDDIVRVIEASWNPSDPQRPLDMGFKASDDWLRSKFEEYICSALAALKFVDFVQKGKTGNVLITGNDPTGLSSFNESWLAAFKSTPAYAIWNAHTDPVIFDLVEPRHPCEGQAHLLEDVGIRLANGLHDLHLDERLGPTQEAITKGLATGSEGVWKVYSSLKSDLARRQAEYRERKEREQREREVLSPDEQALRDMEAMNQQLLSTQVLAGAAEVGGRAANLASNFSSFLGSKLAKQKVGLFSPTLPASTAESVKSSSERGTSPRTSSDQSTTTIADRTPADDQSTVNRPPARASFFSSFRTPLSPIPSSSSPPTDAADDSLRVQSRSEPGSILPASTSTMTSTFGNFFRRSSSSGSSGILTPPTSIFSGLAGHSGTGVRASQNRSPVDDMRPSRLSSNNTDDQDNFNSPASTDMPEGFEDVSAAWAAEARHPLDPVQDDRPTKQSKGHRTSLSMSSTNSDVDMMTDVKL